MPARPHHGCSLPDLENNASDDSYSRMPNVARMRRMSRWVGAGCVWLVGLLACGGNGGGQDNAGTAGTGSGTGGGAAGSSGVGGSSGGRGGAGAAGTGGAGELPSCSYLDYNGADRVGVPRTADPAPTAMGGSLAGGLYRLTAMQYYGGIGSTGPCNMWSQDVMEIVPASATEGLMRFTYGPTSDFDTAESAGWTYTIQGATLIEVGACRDQFFTPFDKTEPFTATADQIVFFRQVDAGCWQMGTLALTFSKQP